MNSSVKKEKIEDKVKKLPHSSGVYLFKDGVGKVIYVGKAKDLRNRVQNYFREGGDSRFHVQFLLKRVAELDYMVTETEQEALILENNLIKKHRPRYNIFLKDDKTYVNLRMNINHPFPRLTVIRNPRSDGALYFGPFASAGAVRATLRTIGRIFPLRTCTDTELKIRKRACLYYFIKRCPGPCVDLIDPQDYKETVNKVIMFLKGKGNELVKSLKKKMELLSAERRYEEAARTRDQIWSIQRTLEKQRITSPQKAERDVFGVYRKNELLVIHSLYVRDGKLSGGDAFAFSNASLSTEEHLSSFLSQYYQRGAVIPAEVVVSFDVPEKAALEAFLSSRKKEKVKILFPKRGERRQMLQLAQKNAEVASKEKLPSSRNRELLEDLQELLNLKKFPRRIECFDVSNIHGRDAVASCVAFIEGDPAKSLYRRYRIRMVEGADDYRMMEETLERRIARGMKEGDLPDLLVLDGGRGQLNVALGVLDRLGVAGMDAVGIAKVREGAGGERADSGWAGNGQAENGETGTVRERAAKKQTGFSQEKEEHKKPRDAGRPGVPRRRIRGKERIYIPDLPDPLLLEGNSTALFLLQRIRDEAHRFAISYHKKLRTRKMGVSAIDDVRGVGPVLKTRLLTEFGSVAKLRKASIDQIASIQGISKALAREIKEFLQ